MTDHKQDVEVLPYLSINDTIEYASDELEMLPGTVELSIQAVTTKETEDRKSERVFVLRIEGDFKDENGTTRRGRAVNWSRNLVSDDAEYKAFEKPVRIAQARMRWGCFERDGELVWASAPKLVSWVTLDGEEYVPQGSLRDYKASLKHPKKDDEE